MIHAIPKGGEGSQSLFQAGDFALRPSEAPLRFREVSPVQSGESLPEVVVRLRRGSQEPLEHPPSPGNVLQALLEFRLEEISKRPLQPFPRFPRVRRPKFPGPDLVEPPFEALDVEGGPSTDLKEREDPLLEGIPPPRVRISRGTGGAAPWSGERRGSCLPRGDEVPAGNGFR